MPLDLPSLSTRQHPSPILSITLTPAAPAPNNVNDNDYEIDIRHVRNLLLHLRPDKADFTETTTTDYYSFLLATNDRHCLLPLISDTSATPPLGSASAPQPTGRPHTPTANVTSNNVTSANTTAPLEPSPTIPSCCTSSVPSKAEYWTQCPVAKAVTTADPATAPSFILSDIVLEFGPHTELLSDNGTHSRNAVDSHLVNHVKPHQLFTSSYHPRTNGLTERYKRTLVKTLAKMTNNAPDN
ncbi:hypothetical protein RI367_008652 [Sorochytrium milnesiophthora]